MNSQQELVMDSCARVRAFVQVNPATGHPGFEQAKAAFDEAMGRLRGYASLRISGRELGRAELRRRDQLIERLRLRHMRAIVTIARAQIEPNSDVRLPVALRMPRRPLSVARMLQACDAMIEAARPFEAVFVANGLPEDFLAQFRQARDELERAVDGRATLVGSRIGAGKGLEVQLVRARRAVDQLDAIYQAAFEGNEAVLVEWRRAKRIWKRPGGSRVLELVEGTPEAPATAFELPGMAVAA
jgi:hypothetical protein